VLDEPNSNLDAEGEQALAKAILTLKGRGAIVVVIAHRTNILSVIDQILIIENGMQAAYGPRDVVLKRTPAASPRPSTNVVGLGVSN